MLEGYGLALYTSNFKIWVMHSVGLYMPRHINLRQIEAFKAVVENGTVSRAATLLNISQPAMSKLIAHLEFDTGVKLFDRVKGRLAPTEQAMRLYEEVGRIFAGVRQVENAVDAIRREEQGRLAIGVMPALSGTFIQRVTAEFLEDHQNVFCSVQSLTSHWIIDWLITRKIDVGLVGANNENPYITREPIMEHPLVCIMQPDHPLAARRAIVPEDLAGIPFVGFHPDTEIGHLVARMFDDREIDPRIALVANIAPTVCEFVAAGVGVSLVHPLMIYGLDHRLALRRFEPDIPYNFQLIRSAEGRNSHLIDAYAERVRVTAAEVSRTILGSG